MSQLEILTDDQGEYKPLARAVVARKPEELSIVVPDFTGLTLEWIVGRDGNDGECLADRC
jgi:hypothetical protein